MQSESNNRISFQVDTKNLYREEAITDLKVASIRRMVPVLADGSDDTSRTAIYLGHTQLMSPEGPLPLQAMLEANNLEEAMEAFPNAMERAMKEMVAELEKMRSQQNEKNDSRIIVPGQ